MSRSRKKYPIGSRAGASPGAEKWFKTYCNGVWRARVRALISQGDYDGALVDDWSNHAANSWTWPKDGKDWFDSAGAGDDWRRDWQRIRNRRKYVVTRSVQCYRSLFQYHRTGRPDWNFDKSVRK